MEKRLVNNLDFCRQNTYSTRLGSVHITYDYQGTDYWNSTDRINNEKIVNGLMFDDPRCDAYLPVFCSLTHSYLMKVNEYDIE